MNGQELINRLEDILKNLKQMPPEYQEVVDNRLFDIAEQETDPYVGCPNNTGKNRICHCTLSHMRQPIW